MLHQAPLHQVLEITVIFDELFVVILPPLLNPFSLTNRIESVCCAFKTFCMQDLFRDGEMDEFDVVSVFMDGTSFLRNFALFHNLEYLCMIVFHAQQPTCTSSSTLFRLQEFSGLYLWTCLREVESLFKRHQET
jgi:hypothetical protein